MASVLQCAVILAAGMGTRLGCRTAACPKVMLPFRGEPLLAHHLTWLRGHGIRRVLINLHHFPKVVVDFCGTGSRFDLDISYSYEESLRGTGGALNGFRDRLDDTFLVHFGDVYTDLNLAKMMDFHCKRGAAATLAVQPTDRPQDCDVVVLGSGDRILELHHKPGSLRYGCMGNAACKILSRRILDYLPQGDGAYDLVQDVLSAAILDGIPVYGYNTSEFLLDIGTPNRYFQLEQVLALR